MKSYSSLCTIAFCCLASTAAGTDTVNPYERPDESEIALSGALSDIHGYVFELDYGDGAITVELHDWERDARNLGLTSGLHVTVYGEIDTDFFTATSIEAEVVYVKDTNTYYYATDDDQLSMSYRKAHEWSEPTYYEISDMTLRGTVHSVDPQNSAFTIVVRNDDEVTVETSSLKYDPLDADSLNPVEKGDSVRVSGRIDYEFVNGKVLIADTLTQLR